MPFSEIRGQDHAVAVLRRSLATGRVAHAYLFEGIPGCGKMLTACSFVQAIFCGSPEPCGSCPACRKMARRQHPDLHFLEPDGVFIKIDQVRELQRHLSLRPAEAPKKACIVSQAEKMNAHAANAFLKTLEEPPGNAVIILLSDAPSSLLPTVLSRCQRLRFGALSLDTIESLLVGSGIPREDARVASSLAAGSMEKARAVVDEGLLDRRREVIEQATSLSGREFAPLTAVAERLASDREAAAEVLEILTLFFRDVMLLMHGSRELANGDLHGVVEQTSLKLTRREVFDRMEVLERARQAVMRNVNPRLALEAAFLSFVPHG